MLVDGERAPSHIVEQFRDTMRRKRYKKRLIIHLIQKSRINPYATIISEQNQYGKADYLFFIYFSLGYPR